MTTRGMRILIARFRALTPEQEAAVRQARASGVPAAVLAGQYGVSRRCIYRVLERAGRPSHRVVLGDYQALFEVSEYGPVQVTAWVPAP